MLTARLKKLQSVTMAVSEADTIADGHVHIRGQIRNKGPEIPRGFISVAMKPGTSADIPPNHSGRLELARWIASPDHPLTARVMANRIWKYLLGEGLVRTPDNFGQTGELPSHPELLNYLALNFINNNYSDESVNPRWDQHSDMPKHEDHARATDQPVAALLQDLKQRGLLEDTLVWWGGEFGRTPFSQGKDGRDHNPRGFTTWLAGGGTKPGYAHGATDEIGDSAVIDRLHMHDLHATLLHLLGLDHERLTYNYAGRNFRLTDVAGNVERAIIA